MNHLIEVPEYEVHVEVRVDPARTALVVVDMQNDFVHQGGGLLVPDAQATIPAINRLLELARAHGIRVVYSQTPTATAIPSGGAGPSTPARAAGAGRSSASSRQRETTSSYASFATTRSTARRWITCCGSGA